MSNVSGDEGSFSSANTREEVLQVKEQQQQQQQNHPHGSISGPSDACNSNSSSSQQQQQQQATKRKRSLPGTPDPNAEVIALSPTTLMATNRFVCEICSKGFQRDQNLQLHRRGHNLPWKLRQRTSSDEVVKKRVYVCPEPSCVHHNPSRALGDLTGIKKHFSRKHGEKKWKCDKCSKRYAVQSDWKAHHKTCGTKEYKCDCGTIFSRRDSFITHRAFCDALTEENNRVSQGLTSGMAPNSQNEVPDLMATMPLSTNSNTVSEFNNYEPRNQHKTLSHELVPLPFKSMSMISPTSGTLFGGPKLLPSPSSSGLQLSSNNFNYFQDSKVSGSAHMSATALLQKAAQMGATSTNSLNSPMMQKSFVSSMVGPDKSHTAGVSGGEAFTNQFFQKGQEEMSLMFDSNNDMGMLGPIFMGSDHNIGLVKNVEQGVGEMTMVHDFLGVGGSTSRAGDLYEPQKQQQQQRSELEALTHQRLKIVNHSPHHLPNGDSAMEKLIRDI